MAEPDYENLTRCLIDHLRYRLPPTRANKLRFEWKTSDYQKISVDIEEFFEENQQLRDELITDYLNEGGAVDEEFGVSDSTIRRIVKYEYDITEPLHPSRKFKLNIISVFLNYKSWDDFKTKNAPYFQQVEEDMANLIHGGIRAKIETYNKLPEINTDGLKEYYKSKALDDITKMLYRLKKAQYSAVDGEKPRFEILKVRHGKGEIEVLVNELWIFWWERVKLRHGIFKYIKSRIASVPPPDIHGVQFVRSYTVKEEDDQIFITDAKIIYVYESNDNKKQAYIY